MNNDQKCLWRGHSIPIQPYRPLEPPPPLGGGGGGGRGGFLVRKRVDFFFVHTMFLEGPTGKQTTKTISLCTLLPPACGESLGRLRIWLVLGCKTLLIPKSSYTNDVLFNATTFCELTRLTKANLLSGKEKKWWYHVGDLQHCLCSICTLCQKPSRVGLGVWCAALLHQLDR